MTIAKMAPPAHAAAMIMFDSEKKPSPLLFAAVVGPASRTADEMVGGGTTHEHAADSEAYHAVDTLFCSECTFTRRLARVPVSLAGTLDSEVTVSTPAA